MNSHVMTQAAMLGVRGSQRGRLHDIATPPPTAVDG